MEAAIPLVAILMPVLIIAITVLGPILLIGLIIWAVVRASSGGGRGAAGAAQQQAADAQLRTTLTALDRMERRVENLETILLERAHSGATERL